MSGAIAFLSQFTSARTNGSFQSSHTKSAFITPFSSSGVFSPLPLPPYLSQDKGGSQPGFGYQVGLESTFHLHDARANLWKLLK
jgi:hypothetical protein